MLTEKANIASGVDSECHRAQSSAFSKTKSYLLSWAGERLTKNYLRAGSVINTISQGSPIFTAYRDGALFGPKVRLVRAELTSKTEALSSTNSVRPGAKKFNMSMAQTEMLRELK
ncbi:hypothetical protein AcV5_008987 [Taiwanofungus camphoratus]|nr:hypothetical protein AcV5_008987 [Antrodia cinnamomea]